MESLRRILSEYLATHSAESLAARLGVSGQAVRNWAAGVNVPAADVIPKLAETTGRDVYELLGVPRPGGPAGLTEPEKLLVATIRILGVDSGDVLKAIYAAPRPPIDPDPRVIQHSAYGAAPASPGDDFQPPPAERDNEDAGPPRRRRGK